MILVQYVECPACNFPQDVTFEYGRIRMWNCLGCHKQWIADARMISFEDFVKEMDKHDHGTES